LDDNFRVSIDLLGANVARGIDRAHMKGLMPTVFNIGNWLFNGVQEPYRMWYGIFDEEAIDSEVLGYSHGLTMVDEIDTAAQKLGITLGHYKAYNDNRHD